MQYTILAVRYCSSILRCTHFIRVLNHFLFFFASAGRLDIDLCNGLLE